MWFRLFLLVFFSFLLGIYSYKLMPLEKDISFEGSLILSTATLILVLLNLYFVNKKYAEKEQEIFYPSGLYQNKKFTVSKFFKSDSQRLGIANCYWIDSNKEFFFYVDSYYIKVGEDHFIKDGDIYEVKKINIT